MYLFYAAAGYFIYKAVTLAKEGEPKKKKKKKKKRKKAIVTPPHEVLGVDRDASAQEVKRAYQRMMAQYHPDRVANAAAELQALAEKRSKEINAAYAAMTKS
jgi:preprotein translocase subunit Sec63